MTMLLLLEAFFIKRCKKICNCIHISSREVLLSLKVIALIRESKQKLPKIFN